MKYKDIRALLVIVLLICVAVAGTCAFFGAILDYNTSTTTSSVTSFTCAVLLLASLEKKKKKKAFYKNLMENKMDGTIFYELVDKRITVRTLDEYVKGVCKKEDGDFLIIEKQGKNSTETVYVNKNTIQTITIKK